MTHTQAMRKIRSMLPEVREQIIIEAERLLKSGGVDLESYDDNFVLPKIVLVAAMHKASRQWSPLSWDKASQKTLKNLSHF